MKILILVLLGSLQIHVNAVGTENQMFTGKFENHKYDNRGKNNGHYVDITYDSNTGHYQWKNKAGRTWTLYPSENANELKVGTDCPYYKTGHTVVTATTDGVKGPGGELYSREFGNSLVIGTFENHKYDNGGKNNWHYVDITYDANANTYTWKNKAGVSWTLRSSSFADILRVGSDCPYYSSGYTHAKFTQMGIYGPGNEFYYKTESKSWFVGTFENHLYDNGGKNNWHYVTITYDATNDKYIWKNRAGISWSLYATSDETILRVGTDCPYYASGYTTAEVSYKGIKGTGNELYTRK